MKSRHLLILVIISAGLLMRLWATGQPANYWTDFDINNFAVTGQIAARGGNIYVEQDRFNYAPTISQVVRWLPREHFAQALRLLLNTGDLIVAALIALLAAPRYRLLAFACWWANPGVLLLVNGIGQFETWALVPFLAAVLLAMRRPNAALIWLLCLLSIMVKHVLLLQVWALFVALWGPRKALLRLAAIGAVFALSFAPYLPDGLPSIIRNVLLYTSWTGVYGVGMVLPASVNALLFYAVLIALPVVLRRRGAGVETILTVSFLSFAALSYGMTEKLLLPLMAWLARRPSHLLLTLSVTLTVMYLSHLWALWGGVMFINWISVMIALIQIVPVTLKYRRLAPVART